MISIEHFKQAEIKIGEILSAEKVPDTDKLLKLSVSFGTETRQVVSGIAGFFPDPSVLVGKKCPFVTNLEPRMIRGLESQAMIMAAHTENAFSLLSPDDTISPGATVI
jgi:methionyl-tRNA synthetase